MTDSPSPARLARRFGLRMVAASQLSIRRTAQGRGFSYRMADGSLIKDTEILARLKSLAVPPAYRHVRFAADARAHLQAVGEDAAGRLQYRYHPDWVYVREARKARHLADLAGVLEPIARQVRAGLRRPEPDKRFTVCAAVRLVGMTAIRAGGEHYADQHGSRGATTLLKAHVKIEGAQITLKFPGKGGKKITKTLRDAVLAKALTRLRVLPGRRLFQYRDPQGTVHPLHAAQVNDWLKEAGHAAISLKDFRALTACLGVLGRLARIEPETSERARRRQINAAIEPLAEELANTLTVCRSSYVHGKIIGAFEAGELRAKPSAHQRTPAAQLANLLGGE